MTEPAMTEDEIRRALADRNLRRVATATGLHHNTLIALRLGRKPHPATMDVLARYLQGRA